MENREREKIESEQDFSSEPSRKSGEQELKKKAEEEKEEEIENPPEPGALY